MPLSQRLLLVTGFLPMAAAALMKGMQDPLEDVRQYSLAVLGATKGIPDERSTNHGAERIRGRRNSCNRLRSVEFRLLN